MKNLTFNSKETLDQFKAGDQVAIRSSVTGEVLYCGIIKSIAKAASFQSEYNRFSRFAVLNVQGGVKENFLSTAQKIN